MSDEIRIPFPKLVAGLAPYESRKSLPERLALDWFHAPCSELVHPHMEEACSRYGLEIGTDSFKSALTIYGPLYIVTTLLTKRHPIELLRRAVPAIFRSSIFFGVFTALYARFACLLWTLHGHQNYRYVFWLSPFLMSLVAINIEKSTRRRELAVYMANQTAETLFKMLLSRGWFTYTPFRTGKRALFAAACALLHLFYNWSPADLAPSVHALMRVLAGTKCQNSDADWIENRVRIVTKPILKIAKRSASVNAGEGQQAQQLQQQQQQQQQQQDTQSQGQNGNSPTLASERDSNPSSSSSSASSTQEDISIESFEAVESNSALETSTVSGSATRSYMPPETPTLPDTIEDLVSSYSKSRIMFTINGFVRGFLVGYIVRSALALGPKLFNPAGFLKNARSILKRCFGKGSVAFGLFVSVMVGVPRLVKVVLSKLFGREHPAIDAAAGFIGGACGSMLQSSTEVTLYIASKATEALIEGGVRLGKLPRIPFFVEILYSFTTATLFFAGSLEPWTVRPSYRKFLAKGSGWHYGRFSESDGLRGLRESMGLNKLREQYLRFKKES